jgi:hypothetical protein
VTGPRGGILYLLAAGLLGYLWVHGDLANLANMATSAASGTAAARPITLPTFLNTTRKTSAKKG